YGGAVEADALGERSLQFGGGDRHRLEEPEYVGEPQPDEPDVAFLEGTQNEFLLAVQGISFVLPFQPRRHHGQRKTGPACLPSLPRSCFGHVTRPPPQRANPPVSGVPSGGTAGRGRPA